MPLCETHEILTRRHKDTKLSEECGNSHAGGAPTILIRSTEYRPGPGIGPIPQSGEYRVRTNLDLEKNVHRNRVFGKNTSSLFDGRQSIVYDPGPYAHADDICDVSQLGARIATNENGFVGISLT